MFVEICRQKSLNEDSLSTLIRRGIVLTNIPIVDFSATVRLFKMGVPITKSLELLINTLTSPQSEFRKYLPENDMNIPKIQMVVLTHCGWSTVAGARNEPNQQTKGYLKKVYDILSKNRTLLSTSNPENHLFMLDDFLGSGRISSFESKPMELLKEGETKVIDRLRVTVNKSVDKCKNQLKFIAKQLW